MKKEDWFSEWFDTPYYHILYKNRDENEAETFVSNLVQFLKPKEDELFLDLACGKGRHSIYLNSLGYDVRGCDLSKSSIAHAKNQCKQGLDFFVHDMRNSTKQQFNYILNLFTSIGFFENPQDNQSMFHAVYSDLLPKGYFVIDFLNEEKVRNNLIKEEVKLIEGISFQIKKKIENNFVMKSITFKDREKEYSYFEKVELISLNQFKSFSDKTGFKLLATFGDYHLNKYDANSDRLILIFQKP